MDYTQRGEFVGRNFIDILAIGLGAWYGYKYMDYLVREHYQKKKGT